MPAGMAKPYSRVTAKAASRTALMLSRLNRSKSGNTKPVRTMAPIAASVTPRTVRSGTTPSMRRVRGCVVVDMISILSFCYDVSCIDYSDAVVNRNSTVLK